VTFIRLGGKSSAPRIYVDAEQPTRDPVPGLDVVPEDQIPLRLKRAYLSALNVLAIGEAEATAASCRRVLEGVTARILTDEADRNKSLGRRIQSLAKEHEKLAAPLIELSDLLREGGNLGAHFDDDVETTLTDAERMVELLDYLITYLFVLPQQIHKFRVEVLRQASEEATQAASLEA
jgi:hypothetical protein